MAQVVVRVLADLKKFTDDIGGMDKQLKAFGKGMKDIGGAMSAAITLPLVGIGVAAASASGELNKEMGNVATLIPNATARVLDLKAGVQDLAVQMGSTTKDISGGLYEVISTFGDTDETLAVLAINAKAAKAGLATTTEALGLTAAVTKGYGDTTAEAVQHAADLGFMAVNLGQTTFPELAASIGHVVPVAQALGVTQEELFAQMATLTGVTGDTSEVTTQLRATFQAILKPTGEMTKAISDVAYQLDQEGKLAGGPLVDAWHQASAAHDSAVVRFQTMTEQLQAMEQAGQRNSTAYKKLAEDTKAVKESLHPLEKAVEGAAGALGQTLVQSVGVNDTILKLNDTFKGNTLESGKAWSSIEALTAVLALSGSQADSYTEKLAAMATVDGTTDQAFQDQTQTVNKNGFEMERLQAKVEVLMQKLGDGLGPAISSVLDVASPLVDTISSMADGFSKLDPEQQKAIVAALAVAAAIGPLLFIVGQTVTTVLALQAGWAAIVAAAPGIGAAFSVLLGPVGLVILAIAALALGILYLWNTNEDFRNFVIDAWNGIKEAGATVWALLGAAVDQFGTNLLLLAGPVGIAAKLIIDNGETIKGVLGGIVTYVVELAGKMLTAAKGLGKALLDGIAEGMPPGPLRDKMKEVLSGALKAGEEEIRSGSPSKEAAERLGEPMILGILEGMNAKRQELLDGVSTVASDVLDALAPLREPIELGPVKGGHLEGFSAGKSGHLDDFASGASGGSQGSIAELTALMFGPNPAADALISEFEDYMGVVEDVTADQTDLQQVMFGTNQAAEDLIAQYMGLNDELEGSGQKTGRWAEAVLQLGARTTEITDGSSLLARAFNSLLPPETEAIAKTGRFSDIISEFGDSEDDPIYKTGRWADAVNQLNDDVTPVPDTTDRLAISLGELDTVTQTVTTSVVGLQEGFVQTAATAAKMAQMLKEGRAPDGTKITDPISAAAAVTAPTDPHAVGTPGNQGGGPEGTGGSAHDIGHTIQFAPGQPIPHLAAGGVALSDTIAAIGEGGHPEAVMPLDYLNSMIQTAASASGGSSGGGDRPININVYHPNGDIQFRKSVVTAIREARRGGEKV